MPWRISIPARSRAWTQCLERYAARHACGARGELEALVEHEDRRTPAWVSSVLHNHPFARIDGQAVGWLARRCSEPVAPGARPRDRGRGVEEMAVELAGPKPDGPARLVAGMIVLTWAHVARRSDRRARARSIGEQAKPRSSRCRGRSRRAASSTPCSLRASTSSRHGQASSKLRAPATTLSCRGYASRRRRTTIAALRSMMTATADRAPLHASRSRADLVLAESGHGEARLAVHRCRWTALASRDRVVVRLHSVMEVER